MASKSKKRRRVLGASCILAALIIAGSSFAWFTSKDEVTNRLTASANYDVSIIENFVPPKQFVPGQTVKKEEAVVNTGNIDAFVKQTISSVLEMTVEVPTAVYPANAGSEKTSYITLTPKEVGALEAGSSLAWNPAGDSNKRGVMIGMGIEIGDEEADSSHRFTPTADGLYVFRRAVQKDTATSDDLNYDYVGYYYDATGQTYYKLHAIKVDETKIYTADDDPDGKNYNLYGTLKGNTVADQPVFTFAKEVTTYNNEQPMFYVDGGAGEGGKRLKVVVNGQNAVDNAILGQAAIADSVIYQHYSDYADQYYGKTKYVAPTTNAGDYGAYKVWNTPISDTNAWPASPDTTTGDGNQTGLISYDIYDQETTYAPKDKYAQPDLSNFGYERLAALQGQTRTKLNNTVGTIYDADNELEKGRASRKVVNTGLDAAKDLEAYLGDVYSKIGQAATPTNETVSADPDDDLPTSGGLYLQMVTAPDADDKTAGTYKWHAYMITDEDGIKYPTYTNLGDDPATTARTEVNRDVGGEYVGTVEQPDAPAGFIKFNTAEGGMSFRTLSQAGDALSVMTADTIKEPRFKDPGSGSQGTGDAASTWAWPTTGNGNAVKFVKPSAPATDGDLLIAWNRLVYQTERKMLNLKKQELVDNAKYTAGGLYSETDAARTEDEADRYLALLAEELVGIQADLDVAKQAYDTLVNNVKTSIGNMNICQEKVDAANAEYNTYLGTAVVKNKLLDAGAETPNTDKVTYTMPTNAIPTSGSKQNITGVTAATVVNGAEDTPDENALENKLIDIFGDAAKDTSVSYTAKKLDSTDSSKYGTEDDVANYGSTYTCSHSPQVAAHDATDITTYGVAATKDKVDSGLSEPTDGVVSFKTGNTDPYKEVGAQTPIKNAPYWKDVVTDAMTTYRDGQAQAKRAIYDQDLIDNAYRAEREQLAEDEAAATSTNVILYIDLDHITTLEDNKAKDVDYWQYMGTATDTVSAKEFEFGYTGILESGERSNTLIKSVYFDENTKQHAFRDLKFDINVDAESAQVVYNGYRISSEAAKSSITNIKPSEAEYADSTEKVTWVANTDGARPNPDDYDPNPKDNDVVPTDPAPVVTTTTYNVAAGGATINGVNTTEALTITKVDAVSIADEDYEYKIVDGADVYYGNNFTNATEFKAVVDDTATEKAFATGVDEKTITLTADATLNT